MTNAQPNSLRIHSFSPFDRGGKARWLLTELGVDFDTHWLDGKTKENESPAFLELNPLGRVPVLTVGDQPMFESGAICAYLGDFYADRGIAPALHSPERAKYQQWMYFASATLDVIQTRVMIIEDIPAGEVHTAKLSALQSDLRDVCTALDQALTQSNFLVGNRLTVADICVSYHFFWFKLWPELEVVTRDFPRISAYIARMTALPSALKSEVFSYEA